MQLFLRGIDGTTQIVEASAESSVLELKDLVHSKTGVPVEEQRLTTGVVELSDNSRSLGAYNVEKEANLQLHLRLLGGDDDDELSSGSESESESEEDEDTGLTENQNRLLYMISLYTKKATPHTDEKDEWVRSLLPYLLYVPCCPHMLPFSLLTFIIPSLPR